jgi:eukaryotic-like serine/threonine-protein kinase
MTPVVDVPPGFRAGRWRVGAHIASGSWSSVYAARGDDGTKAALKFIAGGLLSPAEYAQLEEARFNEQADHPRLVRTFETLVIDEPASEALHGAVVVAMERGERNLRDALGDVDPVPVISAICEALVHIHARGWVHGDLKPSNVLLMADDSVRLADFGLARELEGTHAYAPRVGSSDFLPPEWWSERISERGIAVRPTVDIWALGVTIHQLLTGGLHPFPGAEPRARAAAAQAYADRRAPLRLADELPPQWRPIVADCLAPDHASRLPHTAASILARIPGRERVRRWTAWAAAGAAAAVAVAVALVLTVTGSDSAHGAPVTVFNAEAACRSSPSDECRLGLAGDPYARYGPGNIVGHVRHGDRLMTDCYVSGATTVTAEDKRSSDRWYRVETRAGEAWLPAVRLAASAPTRVPRCRE